MICLFAPLSLCIFSDLVTTLSRYMTLISNSLPNVLIFFCATLLVNLSSFLVNKRNLRRVFLRNQWEPFSDAEVEAFLFGLLCICRKNDDLMVFQILCARGITHVGEAEEDDQKEEHGILSEGE